MTRVAVLQSNYVPWKGYFDLIAAVDVFVVYDEVQYTRRDWRNRNLVKTPQGLVWLTIPVQIKGRYDQLISEVQVSDAGWWRQHWTTLVHAYSKAPHFTDHRDLVESLYRQAEGLSLSEVNVLFLRAICSVLGITTDLRQSSEFDLSAERSQRLVDICAELGATTYLSGPAARDYLDVGAFARAGMAVEWMDYSGYPEHPQLHPPFEHGVSILDLLFNAGPSATSYMKMGRTEER